jgi:uracil-DNA glycosylase
MHVAHTGSFRHAEVGLVPEFDLGYVRQPYGRLVTDYPDAAVYPPDSFRVEWGPIFHRGRLDGSARVLLIGQDPAAHEAIARRILVGEAGQRIQGFLTRLGIARSYVLVNTFLYSVFGQGGGDRHIDDAGIAAYRDRWLDAITRSSSIEAIVTLGHLADSAYQMWRATPKGAASTAIYANVMHPTYPESASASGSITKKAAFERLCTSWNTALEALHPVVTADSPTPLKLYGTQLAEADLSPIPSADLPAGLPDWMGSLEAWAARTGATSQDKRATITVTVPKAARTWPPLG